MDDQFVETSGDTANDSVYNYAIIDYAKNTVVNIVVSSESQADTQWVKVSEKPVGIGWLWDGEVFSPPPSPTNTQLLAKTLTSLADAYKADVAVMYDQWNSIVLADGATEETRKANLRTRFLARQTKYSADIAAAKSLYI